MSEPQGTAIEPFLEKIRRLVEKDLRPISAQVEEDERIPEAVVEKFRRLGLFGMSIPTRYGGLGLSTLEEIRVYEELTQVNACFRSRIGTSNSIGSMGILMDGTEAQRARYLPHIASGEWTAAFVLTEPDAGSDAANIRTLAAPDGDDWVINGSKVFITNGDCAQVFTTIVVTDEEKRSRGGVTAFVVERDTPGFTVGPPDRKMGIKGSHTNELVFRNCRVSQEQIIGGPPMRGKGFQTAMRVLDKGRLTMGACALGASQRLLALCVGEVRRRLSAGTPPEALQAAQFQLADMATEVFAARRMLHHAAALRDEGCNVTHEASMVKLFCTEAASRIADRAMDLYGPEGGLRRSQVEMFLRDVRLYRIFEGTSEIQRLVISRHLLRD